MSRPSSPSGVAVRVDVDDAHGGELFGVARAYEGDTVVGYAPFTFSERYTGGRKVIRIGIVRVSEARRRRGIGLELLRALRTEFDANRVELGMAVSREGTKLARSYKRTLLPNPSSRRRRRNPDDPETLRALRFRVNVHTRKGEAVGCRVQAFEGEHPVAQAEFARVVTPEGPGFTATEPIWTSVFHRRKGVASKMVTMAEHALAASWRHGPALSSSGAGFQKGRRRNPGLRDPFAFRSKAVRALELAKRRHARSRANARALRDAQRLPISRGMIRGAFVEVVCPRCFARAVIPPGIAVDVEHRREGCTGRPFVAEIHAKK